MKYKSIAFTISATLCSNPTFALARFEKPLAPLATYSWLKEKCIQYFKQKMGLDNLEILEENGEHGWAEANAPMDQGFHYEYRTVRLLVKDPKNFSGCNHNYGGYPIYAGVNGSGCGPNAREEDCHVGYYSIVCSKP